MTPQARAGRVRAARARLGRASEPRFEVVHWTRGPRAAGARPVYSTAMRSG